MDKTNGKLTVYFEEPFWVGVFERIEDGKLSVAKVIFGAEPKDYEVQEYIQQYYFSLKFSPAVETVVKDIKRNPKRMQREAKKQTMETGIGTKSQQALKLQQEHNNRFGKSALARRCISASRNLNCPDRIFSFVPGTICSMISTPRMNFSERAT